MSGMKTHTLHRAAWIAAVVALAILSTRGASAQNPPVMIGPMTIAVPPGWTPVPGAVPGLVQYNVPTRSPSEQAVVSLTAAPDSGATLAAGHQALWANLVRKTGTPQEQRAGQSGRFVWSEMRAVDSRNAQQWHRMYSTKEGYVHVLVSVAADSAPAFASTLAA